MTDTIHLQLSAAADVSAVLAVCERFGPISSVELEDDTGGAAKVVFFDVRSANSAIETLGATVAQAAGSTRCRSVKLHGAVHLDASDLEKVKGVTPDEEGGDSYVLEFYDSRDAQRVQKITKQTEEASKASEAQSTTASELLPLPPGIEPPPGLGKQQEQLPLRGRALSEDDQAGHAGTAASCSTAASCTSPGGQEGEQWTQHYQVQISGLPNAMLSDPMMSALLEQANLEPLVLNFNATKGKTCGEVLVTLSSPAAAMWCVHHFNGCRWDSNGTAVTATLVDSTSGSGAALPTANAGRQNLAAKMSAGAAAFVPTKGPSALSAAAPAFVPGGGGYAAKDELGDVSKPSSSHSDTSTDTGESLSGDEKKKHRRRGKVLQSKVLAA